MSTTGDQGQQWAPPPTPPGGTTAPPPIPPGATPPPSPPPGYGPPPGPAYPPPPGSSSPVGHLPPPGYPTPSGYGYAQPWGQAPRNEPLAIAGMVCGIAAIPLLLACGAGIVLGVLGVVFGLIAMRRIRDSGGALTGRGMALAGAICGGVALAIFLIYIVVAIIVAASNSGSP